MLFDTVIKNNTYSSMDRVLLEGWLLSNGIQHRIGKYGDMLAKLTWEQINELRGSGWVVKIL